MATSFTKVGEWEGDIDSGFETAQKVAGLGDPGDGYLWKRTIYTISRSRVGNELLTFLPVVGTESAGDNLTVQNGALTIRGNAAQTYVCTKDRCEPYPNGSGIWRQSQLWVSYSTWVEYQIPGT